MSDQEPTPDFSQLLSQLGEMTTNLQAASAQASAQVIEGHAGGGKVRVTMTAGLDVQRVVIDPSVIDPEEAELLGELVVAAFRDAIEQSQQVQAEAMGDLGGPGGLGGLLGP